MSNLTSEDEFILGKIIEYQMGLISRRWQYFATYLVINGIFFNVTELRSGRDILIILMPVTNLISAIIFLQLVSLAARRMEENQIILLDKLSTSIFSLPVDGKFRFSSVTIMIFFAIIAISIGWFYMLYRANFVVGIVLTIIFLLNLGALRWKPLNHDNTI
ncbi:hypothetical protein MNBD_CHLOROFLEXI01-5302 [hydrothermal vent metagenome]|uniref:Uncharacterized protein n=1 Tax=hydrothermal vent metagenome TaxID=652676 RepID=A0A3B0ULT5_9ZZZZ